MDKKAKKKSRKIKVLVILAIIVAGVIFGTAAFGYFYFVRDDGKDVPQTVNNPENLERRISFLLIGTDKRAGDNYFNADSLIVASVDPDTGLISLLSIPRDTRVTLPGSTEFVKINALPMLRGIPELMNQVTDLTGIKLDGYVLTNFEGFKDIIDTLGGITINVEKRMGPFYTGDKVDGVIDLYQGEQRLSGTLALQYARWRNDSSADIGRTARQQKVLMAVAKEILQPGSIKKLPKLIPQFMAAVETNLKLSELLKLSKVASSFDSSNIITQTLPGLGIYIDYVSYWEVNRAMAKEVVRNLLLGITIDRVNDIRVLDFLAPDIKARITKPGEGPPASDESQEQNGGQDPVKSDDDNIPGINPPDLDPPPGEDEPPDSDNPPEDEEPPDDNTPPGEGKPPKDDNPSKDDPPSVTEKWVF